VHAISVIFIGSLPFFPEFLVYQEAAGRAQIYFTLYDQGRGET